VAEAYDDAAVVNGTNMPVAKFKAVPGVGVSGVVTALGRDTTVVVGNRKAVELAGATLLPDDAAMIQRFESKSDGCTIVYTMVDGVVEFLAALSDVVRADS
jgi:cation transport ATPase